MTAVHSSPTQPAARDTLARVQAIADAHRDLPGALLPILHAVQNEIGHVPDGAVPLIAQVLNLSRAEVHGVISFYHHFRTEAPGRHVVQVCRAEACQSVGAMALEAHAKKALGCDYHQTSADNAVTLEPVFCLGLCACGPAAMVDGKLVGMLTPKKVEKLIDEVLK